MRHLYVFTLLILSLYGCKNNKAEKNTQILSTTDVVTTYYLIRHAEKQDGKDPALTEKGEQRAQFWAQHFSKDSLDAVYSTDTKRTMETARPTAEEFNLHVQKYDPSKMYDASFKKETAGKKVLIVGHSNTVPELANEIMGKKEYDDIPMTEFGRLYTIRIKNGEAKVDIATFNDI